MLVCAGRIIPPRGGTGLAAVLAVGLAAVATGQTGPGPDTIALDLARPGSPISPTMFGVFFEDINFAADGGLYPERVKNRSFEFTEPLSGWRKPWRPGEVVNTRATERRVRVEVEGGSPLRGEGRVAVLGSADLEVENSLEEPRRLAPIEITVAPSSSGFDLTLAPRSFTVLRASYE